MCIQRCIDCRRIRWMQQNGIFHCWTAPTRGENKILLGKEVENVVCPFCLNVKNELANRTISINEEDDL